MFTFRDLVVGLALPMVAAAAIQVIGWHRWRHSLGARHSRSWTSPLALGMGFSGGWLALFGWPGFPPSDVANWLLFITPVLVVVGLLDSLAYAPLQARLVAFGGAMVLAIWLVMRPLLANADQAAASLGFALALCGLLWIVWFALLEALASRISAARFSAVPWITATGSSAVLSLSGSQRLGQIAGLLAAASLGMLVVNFWLGRAGTARAAVPVFGVLLGSLLLCGHGYAEMTLTEGVLLAVAPLTPWIAIKERHHFSPWSRAAQLGCVAATVGGAVALAIWQFSIEF